MRFNQIPFLKIYQSSQRNNIGLYLIEIWQGTHLNLYTLVEIKTLINVFIFE